MVETSKWHVRSNGLNFIIMDQHTNTVAEFRDEATAKWVCSLVEQFDLMRDEFFRIKAITDNAEIHGLCDRAVSGIEQHTPVIQQRDRIQRERDDLLSALSTILKRGYHIEASDYETAMAAIEAARHE